MIASDRVSRQCVMLWFVLLRCVVLHGNRVLPLVVMLFKQLKEWRMMEQS
jgi:hypothetical protein